MDTLLSDMTPVFRSTFRKCKALTKWFRSEHAVGHTCASSDLSLCILHNFYMGRELALMLDQLVWCSEHLATHVWLTAQRLCLDQLGLDCLD